MGAGTDQATVAPVTGAPVLGPGTMAGTGAAASPLHVSFVGRATSIRGTLQIATSSHKKDGPPALRDAPRAMAARPGMAVRPGMAAATGASDRASPPRLS